MIPVDRQPTDTLRTRIAAAIRAVDDMRVCKLSDADIKFITDAVIRELNIPDRSHVDDEGRVWEWCGGEPGTWAWRITRLHKREKWEASPSDWNTDD